MNSIFVFIIRLYMKCTESRCSLAKVAKFKTDVKNESGGFGCDEK